jgi:hypothetical protein
MSFHVSFNLDELTPLRFQELCNVLLLNYFSQLITPMVRTGRDGQLDGKLDGPPINYSDLLNAPFAYKAPDGTDSFWVFQCKHTQRENETDRDADTVKALKSEIAKWEKKERRPTHYIFMTNVNLKASTIADMDALGKAAFGFFDLWHEPKISGFIANSTALQKTFYPTRSTSLDITVIDLKSLAVTLPAPIAAVTPSAVAAGPPKDAIRMLAEYEIRFLKTNTSFLETLRVSTEHRDVPEEWKVYTLKSKCEGLLALASDGTSLQWLVDKIVQNNVHVTLWSRFLGEHTEPEDDIATISYNPDVEAELLFHLDRIFECVPGQNNAHLAVDSYLRSLESSILTDVKANKIQDAQDGLYALLRSRADYSSFKADHPEASYPNMRRWGRKPIFGWDFMGLWESVLKNVCDVVLSGQYPESVYDLVIYFPFHLSIDAIRSKRPKESFQAELLTLQIVFWVIVKKDNPAFFDRFLDKLEDLAQAVSDLDHHTRSVPDAEWALGISKEVAAYIAELGHLTLSGKAPLISIDKLAHVLGLATSLDFSSLLSEMGGQSDDYSAVVDVQGELVRKLDLIRKEYLFAWATFSWHQERSTGACDPTFARSLLAQVEMTETVSFYVQNSRADNHDWIESWFRPEGKRVSWSWTADHDVRDVLQLAVLSFPIRKESFENLDLFQVESSHETFVKELTELHARLRAKGVTVSDIATVVPILAAALQYHQERFKDSIRSQTVLSHKKTDEVTTTFQKAMTDHTREGVLYSVDETLGVTEPTHYVGQYSISDKVWFLDETGRSYYDVSGQGSGWAENIISGRLHLLVTKGREIASQVTYAPEQLPEILGQIRDASREDSALLLSPMTIPWKMSSELLANEYQLQSAGEPKTAGRSGRLGKADLFYVRFLKRGELLLVPKMAFSWTIRKKASRPIIEMIDQSSDEAKKIAEKNPGMDLGLKVLVLAREEGTMNYKEHLPAPVLYVPRVDTAGTDDVPAVPALRAALGTP